MGHRLKNHPGRCRFLHGHNYFITVRVHGLPNADTGMVIDFHDLKLAVLLVLEEYDHAFVLEEGDECLSGLSDELRSRVIYVPFPPTAEMLAQHWKSSIQEAIPSHSVSIRVDETQMCGVSA
jgi:6-pyruvoyltetrahydropterin/6-carboxytetrahydropterin synthase